jgi:O-antigen/teichoic acid export membrane protein
MPSPASGTDERVPRRVWGATLWLALGKQWGAVCTLATLALLARALELSEFGHFTFYLALFALADVLADSGTSTVALQRGADPAAFAAAIAAGRRVRAGTGFLAFALLAGTARLLDPLEAPWVALAALAPFSRVLELSSVVFQREIAWGLPVFLRALGATLRFLVVLFVWRAGARGFGPFLAAHALALALGNVTLHVVARARLPLAGPSGERPGARALELLRAALPLAAAGLCQQAYFYADNLFVRALRGEAELGHYNAAVRVFSALVAFAAFATNAALPWLARRGHAGELRAAAARLAWPLFAGACLSAAALWPWSGELLRALYGAGFEAGATALRWLLGALVAVALGAPALTAVVAAGANRAVLAISAAALALNLLLNALLVPRAGMEGAAAATLATETVVLAGSLAVLGGLRRSGSRAARRGA